ncbi:MAG: replication and repair protein RecF [Thermoleophilaceae bacterium]|jgi:DNA replication and repair protein RecF|nr:replication and repair protein RecF [Thermoleophilaceae bacterium]
MRATSLTVRDFRNYERARLELGPGLTVLAGPNGAGKTNLLEALYFGLTGRSCRTANEREVVRFKQPAARVEVEVEADDGPHRLEIGLAPGAEKKALVDGAPVERLASVPVRPLVGVFLPDRLDLVKGAPAGRRAHLDQLVAALWPARADDKAAYSRALAQRNALVARVRGGSAREALLDTWDAEIARYGFLLMRNRADALALVEPAFTARAADLGLPEPCVLRYLPRSKATDAEGLVAELRERRASDLERGFTTHGPHRDDLALMHGGRPLRTLGSQGQQRAGLLALLFAERDALLERERPSLMLLDDVMSELDATRRARLADLVRAGGQTLITTTDVDHVPGADADGVTVAHILDGSLVGVDTQEAAEAEAAA